MRVSRTCLLSPLAILAGILAAGSAQAVPIGVSASLRIEIAGLGPVFATGTGIVDVSGGVYQIPAGLVGLGGVTIPVTSTSSVNSLVATGISNLSGSFAPGGVTAQAPAEICAAPASGEACVSGGGLGGIMALTGLIQVHVIPNLVVIPIQLDDLMLGEGGSTLTGVFADGAPWTTGTVKVGGLPQAPFSLAGSTGGGALTLVSAAYVHACGNVFPVTGHLTLTPLVPEPGGIALIAVGTAGLIGLALRRR